jgi:N-acetylhexosamine 1-kinase
MDGQRSEVLREAIEAFAFDGHPVGSEPIPGGHIHRNFLVTCSGGRYVLQHLNESVFPDLDAVLSNVERVVAHLKARSRTAPELVGTHSGALRLRTTDGSAWRAFRYLEGTVARDTVTRPADAFEAARAFADYVVALGDLPNPPLIETVERFHDLDRRLADLDEVAWADPVGRRTAVHHQLDRVRRLGPQLAEARDTGDPEVPLRIVHNDAKLSNVLFDADTGLATCVVDLDTTMPGQVQHDVGELVRSATTHAPEDAVDEAIVDFDLELLEALATGYVSGRLELAPSEVTAMALAGPLMAFENAVRFLTDHLAGDRYYTVIRPAQNLDRCRTQLRLTELMLESHTETVASFVGAARHSRSSGPPAAWREDAS